MSNQTMNQKHVVLPPIKVDNGGRYVFPWHAYVMLACEIPAGKVASDGDLMKCLIAAYGVELPVEQALADPEMRIKEVYPYWRVVSERGHIYRLNRGDVALEKLRAEGVEVKEPRPEIDSYVVQNFKEKKFDFSCLKVTVLKTDKEIMEKLIQHKDSVTTT